MENWTMIGKALEEGDFGAAIDLLRAYLQENPNNADAWAKLAACLSEASKPDEAIDASKKAIELDPTNIFGWVQLGWSLKIKGNFEDAIKRFEHALELSKIDHDWILAQLAYCHNQIDQGRPGLECAKRALKANPQNVLAMTQRLVSLNILLQYDEARALASEYIVQNPKNEMIYCQKGWAEKSLGDYEAAALSFQCATNLDPDDAWNWAQLAKCYNKIGKYSEAERAAQKVLKLDPLSSTAQEELRIALSSKEPRAISFE
ncbi:MAG: tetratricopeptide repeat protein [Candidatus Hodarchaeota archaeon]